MLYKKWLQIKASRPAGNFGGRHPRWNTLKGKILQGCDCPVKNLAEDVRLLDLEGSLSQGSHKSTKEMKFQDSDFRIGETIS